MRLCDVDALLRSLLPALSIAAGACTGTGAGSASGEPTPRSTAGASGRATTQADEGAGEAAEGDEGDEGEGGDDEPRAKADLATALPAGLERPMRDNYPRCPTVTWCAAQAATLAVAVQPGRAQTDCPTQVTSEGQLTPRDDQKQGESLAGDPVYAQLFTRSRVGPVDLDPAETQKSRDAGNADACCYSWTTPCPGGRPFLSGEGEAVVASMLDGDAWSEGRIVLTGDEDVRREAARQWLADAAMEHASVASFARATLELMALGAPAELIARTQHAALDEIEHAKACFTIARACGSSPRQPGPMAIEGPREADFARLAADTFVEGCIGETTAALAMQRAAAGCKSAALRAALVKIADDETQHAALAWQTLAWAVAQGGEAVREALSRRAENFVASLERDEAAPHVDTPPGLARLGRLSAAQMRQTRRDAWYGIIEPMFARL